MLNIRVPLAVRNRNGRNLTMTLGGMATCGTSSSESTLVKALAQALRRRLILNLFEESPV